MSEYSLKDLLDVMARLRDPQGGCPWDVRQTFDSVLPYTLEEAYEVADAIERQDYNDLKDELGDLLFQVVFHARIAEEQGMFAFQDVVQNLVEKLVRRHPHVFPHGDLSEGHAPVSEEVVNARWEAIKEQERQAKAHKQKSFPEEQASVLDEVPVNLPALTRAVKLQKKAASIGFDWNHVTAVLDKLDEELREFREAVAEAEKDPQALSAAEDELGDVLFVCANIARHLGIKPEIAARKANRKFERRFRHVERQAREQQVSANDLDTLESFWQEAKNMERQRPDAASVESSLVTRRESVDD